MSADTLFVQAFVYLAAALLVVPVARRLGLGSVLGYLLAGVAIGPFGLGLVGEEGADVMHFAEFGVVMMLFLVGLELEPARLWRLRGPILGLGGLQVAGTAVAVAIPARLLGLPWQQAVAVGLVLAMSSTAIALQSLAEKGQLKTDAGQKSFSVLLFQDISVIPMLALFPLLATLPVAGEGGDGHGATAVDHLPAWAHAGVVLAAVVGVVAAGRFLVRPALRAIARTGLREMFTAASLVLVIGVTLLMTRVGLSPALGTFLAGVVLANSEYRHELESDIEPFKGLLLGLFFLAVGASIDFGLVAAAPGRTAALLVGITAIKAGVLFALARRFGTGRDQAALFAVALCQVGEFAFVLLAMATRGGVLPGDVAGALVATTALSMAASPLLLAGYERLLQPRLAAERPTSERAPDVEDEENPVIVAGFGRFGQVAGRFLRAHGVGATVLDVDGDQVEVLRTFGHRVFYGDASRLDLLHAAGAAKAKLLIVAVDDQAKAVQIVHTVRKHFPHLAILARARGRTEAHELIDLGVEDVYRETFDTSLRAGVDALVRLGVPRDRADRGAEVFRRYDEDVLREMATLRHDRERLVATGRARIQALNDVLRADRAETTEGAADETGPPGERTPGG